MVPRRHRANALEGLNGLKTPEPSEGEEHPDLSRRDFVRQATAGGLAVLGVCAAACSRPWGCKRAADAGTDVAKADGTSTPARSAELPTQFPVVTASGNPLDLGVSVGAQCKDRIHTLIKRRKAWHEGLKAFALADRATRLDGFVTAIQAHHPQVLAELQGIAKGAELAFEDILVLNLQTELGAMNKEQRACDDCSTLYLDHGGRILLAHNEDGDDANRDLMALLHMQPTGQPAITAFAYPGVLPGCVPARTSAGLVMSTNFIGAAEVRVGVPRYVLGRAVLSATSLDQAVATATSKHAAYSFHLNLGSTPEKRAVAVDVAVGRSAVQPVEGLYLQTNHFVLEPTQAIEQPWHTPGSSSDSRYRVLSAAIAKLPALSRVTAEHLIRLLASHEAVQTPYSPCRHPRGEVHGRTLGTALFDVVAGTFTLYEGNPCVDRKRLVAL